MSSCASRSSRRCRPALPSAACSAVEADMEIDRRGPGRERARELRGVRAHRRPAWRANRPRPSCRRLPRPATTASTSVRSASSVAADKLGGARHAAGWRSRAGTSSCRSAIREPPRRWDELDAVLDQFDATASLRESHPPRPTLAHAPTPERAAHPGQAGRNRSLALSPAARSALVAGVAEALERCRARGLRADVPSGARDVGRGP